MRRTLPRAHRSPRPRRARAVALLAAVVLGAAVACLSGPSPAGATTVSVPPEADATVTQASPATNLGTATSLSVDGSPVVLESYLRFMVSGVDAPVSTAMLRLWVTNPSANGPALYPTGNGWTETGITWANKPARTGAAAADKGATTPKTWVEYDVTSLVPGNGTYSFDLASDATDGFAFPSREAATNRPQLVVTTGSSPRPRPRRPAAAPPAPSSTHLRRRRRRPGGEGQAVHQFPGPRPRSRSTAARWSRATSSSPCPTSSAPSAGPSCASG